MEANINYTSIQRFNKMQIVLRYIEIQCEPISLSFLSGFLQRLELEMFCIEIQFEKMVINKSAGTFHTCFYTICALIIFGLIDYLGIFK